MWSARFDVRRRRAGWDPEEVIGAGAGEIRTMKHVDGCKCQLRGRSQVRSRMNARVGNGALGTG
eukprot:1333743-Alexandrium_andersonii.AAC.1